MQTLIQHKQHSANAIDQSIPYEIICRIFLDCRRVNASAPATISHVCRSWRQIALSQRELWTRIELGRKETGLQRASIWAERAATLPISIGIRYDSEHIDYEQMLAWLQDKASQIKYVTILHMDRNAKNALLPLFPLLKLMESFQVLGLEDIDLDIRWIARILDGSPRLVSLSLSGVGGLHFYESMAGVASQLTHLSLGAHSHIDYAFPLRVDAVLDIISACTGLVSLECHALGEEEDHDPLVVSLPSLSSLTIGDGPETCLILNFLRAPQLRTFRLIRGKVLDEKEEEVEIPHMDLNRDGYIDLFIDCVRGLHEICSPPITEVIWDGTIVDIGVLGLCAPYLRGMEKLEGHDIGEVPLNFLALGTELERHPFASLRSIVFTKCTIRTQWLDAIRAVISRQVPIHSPPIEQLIVEDCHGTNDIYIGQA